jgi:hypothetical protein
MRGPLNGAFHHWQVGRRVSTFDPMATAIDWLGLSTAHGKAAIFEYWLQRFADRPAGALMALQPDGDGVSLTYRVPNGPVQTILHSDSDGKIARSVCGPANAAP